MTHGHDRRERGSFLDLLYRSCVPLLILVVIVVIGYRSARPMMRAEIAVAADRLARGALVAIHKHQVAAFTDREEGDAPPRCDALSTIVAAAPDDSPLRAMTLGDEQGVELLTGAGYHVALFLVDPEQETDRAWSAATASEVAGERGYGAYAWPERYSSRTQWAYFIDHRGKLLGSWNFDGRMSGTAEPFPPPDQPLGEYLRAEREDEDAEWFLFDRPPLDEVPMAIEGDRE